MSNTERSERLRYVKELITDIDGELTKRKAPKTVLELMRKSALAGGEKMRQEGGVQRFALQPSLGVRATLFGAYDAAIVAKIDYHWHWLLKDNRAFDQGRAGKVVLAFRLNYDGKISNLKVEEYDVGEILSILCQMAVKDPAPFDPWPSDMRRQIGADYRDVKFTFFYN